MFFLAAADTLGPGDTPICVSGVDGAVSSGILSSGSKIKIGVLIIDGDFSSPSSIISSNGSKGILIAVANFTYGLKTF